MPRWAKVVVEPRAPESSDRNVLLEECDEILVLWVSWPNPKVGVGPGGEIVPAGAAGGSGIGRITGVLDQAALFFPNP